MQHKQIINNNYFSKKFVQKVYSENFLEKMSDLEQNNLLNNKKYYPYLETHFVHFALKHYILNSTLKKGLTFFNDNPKGYPGMTGIYNVKW